MLVLQAPDDKVATTPGASSAYPTLPLPYAFPDGSDLSHTSFYPAQVIALLYKDSYPYVKSTYAYDCIVKMVSGVLSNSIDEVVRPT